MQFGDRAARFICPSCAAGGVEEVMSLVLLGPDRDRSLEICPLCQATWLDSSPETTERRDPRMK